MSTEKPEGKTPHQGDGRVYGKFKCPKCKRDWSSKNSWANMGQKCMECKTMVYPYSQSDLGMLHLDSDEYSDDYSDSNESESDDEWLMEKEDKPHITELCEKCQKLGYSCRQLKD